METPEAVKEVIVHPLYSSPRWRLCPLDLFAEEQGCRQRTGYDYTNAVLDSGLLVELIFEKLIGDQPSSARDILNLGATCKRLRALSLRQTVWQAMCLHRFSVDPELPIPGSHNGERLEPSAETSFRVGFIDIYRFNHELYMDHVRGRLNVVRDRMLPSGLQLPIRVHA